MKKFITIALFLFVAASVVKLVLNETQKTKVSESAEVAQPTEGTKTVVYYFHGDVRCATCNEIEANTNKAIDNGFPEMLESGDMLMRVVNMEAPENERFVTNYKLTNSSVVVSQLKDGKEVKWARLDKAWDLIGNEDQFIAHIQQEIRTIIEAGH